MENSQDQTIVMNEKSMEVLIAKFIPTSQYFEARFDHMQYQINEIKDDIADFKKEMNDRFVSVDKRFEQVYDTINEFKNDVNKRFEQVDKRFEQVDKRFEQVDKKIEKFKSDVDMRFKQVNDSIIKLTFKIEELTKAQEVTIRDYIIERDRHYDAKFANLRMFNIATISLVAGVILKMMGVIHFG